MHVSRGKGILFFFTIHHMEGKAHGLFGSVSLGALASLCSIESRLMGWCSKMLGHVVGKEGGSRGEGRLAATEQRR